MTSVQGGNGGGCGAWQGAVPFLYGRAYFLTTLRRLVTYVNRAMARDAW